MPGHNHTHHNCKHSHHHGHHTPTNYNHTFIFGITLNFTFVIIEALYGYFSNSLALMADAGHNLSDVAGLFMAWGAYWLSSKKPTHNFTFGLRKSSIFSALFNALFLMAAIGIIIWEAFHRLWNPNIINHKIVIIVASIGIIINAFTALLFFKKREDDINIKGAYLHMAADALISVGVVISGIIISYTSWNWFDPFMSILISLVIIYVTWDLLKQSMRLSLDAVPSAINPHTVKKYLENIENVVDVHDLHIWAMSTTETALSVHLTVQNYLENATIVNIASYLNNNFKIHHPTIQVELYEENFQCLLKPDDVL